MRPPRALYGMSEKVSDEVAKSAEGSPARTVPLARGLSIKLVLLTVLLLCTYVPWFSLVLIDFFYK